jgi:hypothetical protein
LDEEVGGVGLEVGLGAEVVGVECCRVYEGFGWLNSSVEVSGSRNGKGWREERRKEKDIPRGIYNTIHP